MRRSAIALLATVLLTAGLAAPPWGAPYPPPGETTLLTLGADGTNPGGAAFEGTVVVSRDGRYAVFETPLPLDAEDDNGVEDIYRRDLVTGALVWVSQGNDADGHPLLVTGATEPTMSADGSYVAFTSTADVVDEDTNGYRDVYLRDLETGELSVLTAGTQGLVWAGHSDSPHVSGDGRYVVFRSSAALVADDTNEGCDDYLIDRESGSLERVSLAGDGSQLAGQATCSLNSHGPQVSDDGRFVAFVSNSPDVTPHAKVFPTQVYVRDRLAGTTELVSVNDHGEPANYVNHRPVISSDGRFVAFISGATNLVPGDRDASADVYVRDRAIGRTEQVSVDSAGRTLRGDGSLGLDVSDDGRYAIFTSWAELDGDDGSFTTDVWRHDRLTGATERLTVDTAGEPATGGAGGVPSLSGDGRYAGFSSGAAGLDPRDTPPEEGESFDVDSFRRDLGPDLGVGAVDAEVSGGTVEVSGWARFDGTVASATDPGGEVDPAAAALGLDLVGARIVHRPERGDLFVRLDLDELPPARPPVGGCCEAGLVLQQEPQAGVPGTSYEVTFDVAGVTWAVRIQPHQGPTTGTVFPFVTAGPRIVLERCTDPCTPVADLAGAVGAVGTAVTASVPLELLEAEPGDVVTQPRALTRFGPAEAGVTGDELALPDIDLALPAVQGALAPIGAPPEFTAEATLNRGRATASLDAGALSTGDYEVWLRACLAERCGTASTTIIVR